MALTMPGSWDEFLDYTAFSSLGSSTQLAIRLNNNFTYFGNKYLALVPLVVLYDLFSNPWCLIILAILYKAWHFYGKLYLQESYHRQLAETGLFDRGTVLILAFFTVFVVLFFSDVGYVVFMALVKAAILGLSHAAFMVPHFPAQ